MSQHSQDRLTCRTAVRRAWAAAALACAAAFQPAAARQQVGPDPALARSYDSVKSERRLYLRDYERNLQIAFDAGVVGDLAKREQAEKMLRAALGDLVQSTPEELASRITMRGSADAANFDMRDAAIHLAMLWKVTGDASHAQRAAALLARFAQAIPQWPVWSPYYGEQSSKKALSQSDAETFRSEFSAGLWGAWIYEDLIMGTPLAQAWSILRPSGELQRLGAEQAVRAMLDLHVATQRKYNPSPDFSNMDAFQIRGLMDFGRLLPDPELVHEGVRHLRNMYRVGFFPDGWWHEGATSYHLDLQDGLRKIACEMLRGYSDPTGFRSKVDGSRYDNLDLRETVAAPSRRADIVTQRMTLPDQTLLAVHDTAWPQLAPQNAEAPTHSFLFGAMGHGTLVAGSDANLSMASLHWSGSGSHSHRDALSLNLWAKGTEVMSETQYHPVTGSDSTREWHTSTAGHATVVVDGKDQSPEGRFGSRLRKPQPLDAIPGIPDWPWRWTTCAAQDFGTLRLFSTDFREVQVVEADAERAYDSVAPVKLYRRTIALVCIGDQDSYAVDIFRIRGGGTFDYMLHSALQFEQTVKVSLALQPMQGVLHGNIHNLRSASTDDTWLAAFELGNGVNMLTFMAGAPRTKVSVGEGPAMRRVGSAPFVAVSREGPETVFVAVHHVVKGSVPRVQGIELLPATGSGCVALRIRLGDRTDTVISCEEREQSHIVDGRIEVRARFAHLSEFAASGAGWSYMVDGDLLRTPRETIQGEVSWCGAVERTLRSEEDEHREGNGFVVDSAPPPGRVLEGAAIVVDLAGQVTWGYRLTAVAKEGDACVLQTADEPGFSVKDGTIKQLYFPCWGFVGKATWRIPGFALSRRGADGGQVFKQSRDAKRATANSGK